MKFFRGSFSTSLPCANYLPFTCSINSFSSSSSIFTARGRWGLPWNEYIIDQSIEIFHIDIDRLYLVNGLARSGNHLFISWLISGLPSNSNIIYFNNVKNHEFEDKMKFEKKLIVSDHDEWLFDKKLQNRLMSYHKYKSLMQQYHTKNTNNSNNTNNTSSITDGNIANKNKMKNKNRETIVILSSENKECEKCFLERKSLFTNVKSIYAIGVLRDALNLLCSANASQRGNAGYCKTNIIESDDTFTFTNDQTKFIPKPKMNILDIWKENVTYFFEPDNKQKQAKYDFILNTANKVDSYNNKCSLKGENIGIFKHKIESKLKLFEIDIFLNNNNNNNNNIDDKFDCGDSVVNVNEKYINEQNRLYFEAVNEILTLCKDEHKKKDKNGKQNWNVVIPVMFNTFVVDRWYQYYLAYWLDVHSNETAITNFKNRFGVRKNDGSSFKKTGKIGAKTSVLTRWLMFKDSDVVDSVNNNHSVLQLMKRYFWLPKSVDKDPLVQNSKSTTLFD